MTASTTTRTDWKTSYSDNAAENYQKYFVPVIGGPAGLGLVNQAGLRPGERVLDVACGTGTIARLAAERVGTAGRVSAIDVNAAMLMVARSLPAVSPIKWYETSAESVPLPDESFDVVFCGLGLQFFADKMAALREMRRVLKPRGRVYISTPVPNAFFDRFDRAIARHVGEDAAAFVHSVFALHDPREMEQMLTGAGFTSIIIEEPSATVQLPSAREFMWHYISCTPLMALLSRSPSAQVEALEREVVESWKPWIHGEGLQYEQSTLISHARR